jgi:hypothetical protein
MSASSDIDRSLEYLASDAALASVEADPYWPKWDAPWWHMLLLYEIGEGARIPGRMVERYVDALSRIPLKVFPITPEDVPAGVDPSRCPCHCQLGTVYQVLSACGVDVDADLPWIRPWFFRYQMEDGGLNCDETAYRVKGDPPSSMVGTIGAFEAVLLYTPRPYTEEERRFLDRAAGLLIRRKLSQGSHTSHNAEERESATRWPELVFPRFYFYDVLRGLRALLLWGDKTGQKVPASAVEEVARDLDRRFPDGQVVVGRRDHQETATRVRTPGGEWIRQDRASEFPLLASVSAVGAVSPYLSRQWREARAQLPA